MIKQFNNMTPAEQKQFIKLCYPPCWRRVVYKLIKRTFGKPAALRFAALGRF